MPGMSTRARVVDDRIPAVESPRPRVDRANPARMRPLPHGASSGAPTRGGDVAMSEPQNSGATPQRQQPASGANRNLIVAAAVIALVVIVGVVAWLVTRKSPDQGAPGTGSIQQPAVPPASGGFDPKTVLEPGKSVPSNWGTFLDGPARDSFRSSISKFQGEDLSVATCYYGLNRTSGVWFGFIACGPTKSSASQDWWESDASVNPSNDIVMSPGAKWSRSSGPPARGVTADGSPVKMAG